MTPHRHTMREIIAAVCAETRVTRIELFDGLKNRHPDVVKARWVAVGLIIEVVKPTPSLPEIAQVFGMKRHSSTHDRLNRWLALPESERQFWRTTVLGVGISNPDTRMFCCRPKFEHRDHPVHGTFNSFSDLVAEARRYGAETLSPRERRRMQERARA